MRFLLAAAIAFAALLSLATCVHLEPHNIGSLLLPSYDYIVVGGGTSGLVVANRLTEDPNVTVLVLEAGELDTAGLAVTIPGLVGRDLSTRYDWNLTTTPQSFLDNETRPYNAGRVVGGSSLLNGMVWTRGSMADYDAWEALGNPGWGWNGLLPYFKKSETFTPEVEPRIGRTFHIHPDMSAHGTQGPVQVAYPRFIYDQSNNFLQGLAELGIPILQDPNTGTGMGAMIVPSSILPKNQSRSDSRTSYIDDAIDRPNLHLATEQTVNRIQIERTDSSLALPPFGKLMRASGVEFTATADGVSRNVTCSKQIILAAGAIKSPVLLQVSGIGPAPILSSINVSVQIDLPGVGMNLQDHGMVGAFYNYSSPGLFTANDITGDVLRDTEDLYVKNRTGPWTAPLISTVAFPPLNSLTHKWSSLLSSASLAPPNVNLPPGPGQHPTLIRGFALQRQLTLAAIGRPDAAASELMADSVGLLTTSGQRPLSRGSVRALSSSSSAAVAVDPRYLADPLDAAVLVAALRFAARVASTSAVKELRPSPGWPWVTLENENEADEDEEEVEARLLDTAKRLLRTEFHPCGTTAMLPLDLGGVVDPQLRVYGTANLRVVDAGIMPLIPAAHLQAVVYAVAEKATDIIKQGNDHTGGSGGTAYGFQSPAEGGMTSCHSFECLRHGG